MQPNQLVARRQSHGLSLRRLAAITGINYVRIHFLEHGAEPRVDELARLARALGCDVADLQPAVPR
jgi:transcriptional regulator with XRE-family HTH domain